MAYKDLVPVGSTLIIAATSFALGVIYSNWPYDVHTLWRHDSTGEFFEQSLRHYTMWATAPMYVHYTFHAILGLGFVGCFIKLFKPLEDAKYFEYGTLAMYMAGVVIYLSNLRIGINSCRHGDWGDVDMPTGINVIAASQVMIVFALVGVLVLQGGLYYAQWYDARLKAQFLAEEAEREAMEQKNETKTTAGSKKGSSSTVESAKTPKNRKKKQ
ncbi:Piso0_000488 [Millerozyma farinosa CBS 7064]|uniref:Piso0_000488 protein n=1 Tax=Pichia sorbitophila (strain ATCC MYA-4447 / BCRC 22081 / CBS 7064 / NBRC 10061 / NRRL Y-12695) TaxID=559304 RepID=G8YVK3_PICSO|nr:Piso0_000488 [Millerozyma farinosa CBS 7064]CCE73447.1 Piso0_000488 [Millerozyma farinosa CBS 7064]